MESFLIPAGVVALAELGDKTQLLAFLLAARFRTPWPVIAGILAATLANHLLAGAVGAWLSNTLGPEALRWIVGLAFIAVAAWMLWPEEEAAAEIQSSRFGAFGTTAVAFFLAEMGDKTQVATMAMVAHFDAYLTVIAGTTLGMMMANVPAVYLGDRMAQRLPTRLISVVGAVVFAVLGALVLTGFGERFGL